MKDRLTHVFKGSQQMLPFQKQETYLKFSISFVLVLLESKKFLHQRVRAFLQKLNNLRRNKILCGVKRKK